MNKEIKVGVFGVFSTLFDKYSEGRTGKRGKTSGKSTGKKKEGIQTLQTVCICMSQDDVPLTNQSSG